MALVLLLEADITSLRPDARTYSAAIGACEKGHQWEQALHLLSEMLQCGLDPNIITCSSVISACEKGLQWERALQLLLEVKQASMHPTAVTYNAVISACEKCEQWQRALELLSEMRETATASTSGRPHSEARHCGPGVPYPSPCQAPAVRNPLAAASATSGNQDFIHMKSASRRS